jgi:hypothetical protein
MSGLMTLIFFLWFGTVGRASYYILSLPPPALGPLWRIAASSAAAGAVLGIIGSIQRVAWPSRADDLIVIATLLVMLAGFVVVLSRFIDAALTIPTPEGESARASGTARATLAQTDVY